MSQKLHVSIGHTSVRISLGPLSPIPPILISVAASPQDWADALGPLISLLPSSAPVALFCAAKPPPGWPEPSLVIAIARRRDKTRTTLLYYSRSAFAPEGPHEQQSLN